MAALARDVYELQLERVRLRAVAARQRRDARLDDYRLTRTELDRLEETLVTKRSSAGEHLRDHRLALLLRLSPLELDLLWSVVAATSDPLLTPQLRDLAEGEGRFGISLAVYAVIAELQPREARELATGLTPVHPLLRYGVLEQKGDSVPAAQMLRAPARVASYLSGQDTLDDVVVRTGGLVRITEPPTLDQVQRDRLRQVISLLSIEQPIVVVLEGPRSVGKRTLVALGALAVQRSVLQVDVSRMSSADELELAFIALRRECLLNDAVPLVAEVDAQTVNEPELAARTRALGRLLDETPITVVLTSTSDGIDISSKRRVVRLRLPIADASGRLEIWQRAVGVVPGELDLTLLASRYRLGAGRIQEAVASARLLAGEQGALTTQLVTEGVRNGIDEQLASLATRLDVRQEWADLVLSPDTLDQIRALISRVRHGHVVFEKWGFHEKLPRGLGTAGLFSGPPGTGKTMVAGIIARELDLELYQVDLSKVVSKWVGETEKQLAKIFDAADAGHALLLFDEADSLFAKRTEVKSAIDRYANLEVNYLLQRIENFGGMAILTTNLDTSIDPALRRRLAAHIVFYPPDVVERTRLWEQLLPKGAPRSDDLDFEDLAEQFPDMTGANIRNAVVAGAFLAASEGSPITREHLRRAGRGEYRAMGRVIR